MHLTIQGEWQAFEAAVIPADAGSLQRRDMFIAFFAGVEYMTRIHDFIATLSDPAAMAVLEHIRREVDVFRDVLDEVSEPEQRKDNDELH